jgi:hypothetical protein
MLPELKVYKIDYEFIIKNYLDRNLWKKTWNLFIYRDNIFTLNLYEIDTENNKIRFKIKFNKLEWMYESITYDVDNTSIKILLQQINGAMFRLIERFEEREIKQSSPYKQAENAVSEEREKLREIARSFLDSEGVSNEDIRDAYIEKFVDRNETMYWKREKVLDTCRYTVCTDMFIVFCKATKDDVRLGNVEKQNLDKSRLRIIESEVEAFLDTLDTEDYENEMIGALESVF